MRNIDNQEEKNRRRACKDELARWYTVRKLKPKTINTTTVARFIWASNEHSVSKDGTQADVPLWVYLFADDQALVIQDYEDINYMTHKFTEEYAK